MNRVEFVGEWVTNLVQDRDSGFFEDDDRYLYPKHSLGGALYAFAEFYPLWVLSSDVKHSVVNRIAIMMCCVCVCVCVC